MKHHLAAAAFFLSLTQLGATTGGDSKTEEKDLVQLLSSGNQSAAEHKLATLLQAEPNNPDLRFWKAVFPRSRFELREAAPAFYNAMIAKPDSPEGLASACVLGVDLSRDQWSALYYFNALLILCDQQPGSVPLHWMAAVMARTLTNRKDFHLGTEARDRILLCGVREYETLLKLMAPGPGPVLAHQTMANLLDELQGYDLSLRHRELAVQLEKAPWSLQGEANTLLALGRPGDALPLVQEAVSLSPKKALYLNSLALVYWELGRKQEAIAAIDKACQIEPRNQDYLRTASLFCKDFGNYAAARKYTKSALTNHPDDRFFQIWDARLAALLGEPGATALLRKAGTFDFQGNPINPTAASLGKDPWFEAVADGDLRKVIQLKTTGDINRKEGQYEKTALMNAAQAGWDTIVAELIRSGAKLDDVDTNGDTALNYSAQFRNPRAMKLLLDAGANPNIQDKWKQSPLLDSASRSNHEAVDWFLAKHADVHLAKFDGTALHYAAGHGDIISLNALIKHGADVNADGLEGTKPLIQASQAYPHSQVLAPLLSAGAKVNAQDKQGCTALFYAINPLLNIPLVELLLEDGADPTLKNNAGTSPITHARLLGFDEIASLMEKKIGHAEPFEFPHFSPAATDQPKEMQNACYFVLPILLAQGDPLGRPSGVASTDKDAARTELDRMFGIRDDQSLKAELEMLVAFEPRYRDEAADLFGPGLLQQLGTQLKSAVMKIHASCNQGSYNETAWVKAHIIYLADLGICAGFLKQEDGDKLTSDASKEISRVYSSWPEYLKSIALGAQFHNGWEANRYQNICQRILAVGPQWPL